MKKIYSIVVIACGFLFVASCDYVSNPHPNVNANLGDTASCSAPTFPAVTTHVKKILIEDFTGHTCGNCPQAAVIIHQIDSTYPGRIIGMAIHTGDLSKPEPGYNSSPSTAYTADFRTAVGEQYYNTFLPFAFPLGMINRRDFDASSDELKPHTSWGSYVATIIGDPSTVDLQIINDYTISTRKLCTSIRTTFLTNTTGTYKLVALLTQDSIIDWQYNNVSNLSNYRFDHMLRDAITPLGAWGEALASGTILANTTNTQKFAYTIPAEYAFKDPITSAVSPSVPCDPKECYIVAFVYNTATYEIIQSEKIKVTP